MTTNNTLECPVCFNTFNTPVHSSNCEHNFCLECYNKFPSDKGCPLCRRSLSVMGVRNSELRRKADEMRTDEFLANGPKHCVVCKEHVNSSIGVVYDETFGGVRHYKLFCSAFSNECFKCGLRVDWKTGTVDKNGRCGHWLCFENNTEA